MVNVVLEQRSQEKTAIGIGVLLTLGGIVYYFREPARERVIEEISDVASRSLGDDKVQRQAEQASIQTLQALLEHEATVERSVEFISAVCESEKTRGVLIQLLVDALKSRAVVEQALGLVLWVLDNDKARENVVTLLIAALHNERFLEAAGSFAVSWLQRDEVRAIVADVFKGAALEVLENPSVRSDAEIFLQQMLQQPQLQAKTSEHLWAAVKGLVIAPKVPKKPSTARLAHLNLQERAANELPTAAAAPAQPPGPPPSAAGATPAGRLASSQPVASKAEASALARSASHGTTQQPLPVGSAASPTTVTADGAAGAAAGAAEPEGAAPASR